MFTSGEVLVKILQTRRIIVTQFTYEGFLGIFGDFWVQVVIVRTTIGAHIGQMQNGGNLYINIRKNLYMGCVLKTF